MRKEWRDFSKLLYRKFIKESYSEKKIENRLRFDRIMAKSLRTHFLATM